MKDSFANQFKKSGGFVLVAVTIVLGILTLLVFYFLDFVISDSKISRSQLSASQTYYLAEAGIQEAIWKLKNTPGWLTDFQTNPTWAATITRQNVFWPNSSYTVTLRNTDLAEAEIIADSSYQVGPSLAQRVVKTKIFQALNPWPLEGQAIFNDADMNFTGSVMTVNGGGLFANDDINLDFFSNVTIENDAQAVDQIGISWASALNAADLKSANYPPAPAALTMPQVDFNSADPNSFKNRASAVYTTGQFNQLLAGNPTLTLNGIIYVTGNAIISRGTTLTINGALVAEGNINIGTEAWPFWKSEPSVIINQSGSNPAGILSQRKINIGSYTDGITVHGLMYATDELKMDAYSLTFYLDGGIISRNLNINSLWNPLTLNYNSQIIADTLGNPQGSPVINIEHWEEEY